MSGDKFGKQLVQLGDQGADPRPHQLTARSVESEPVIVDGFARRGDHALDIEERTRLADLVSFEARELHLGKIHRPLADREAVDRGKPVS